MPNNFSRKASCFVFLPTVLMLAVSAALAQVQPDNNVERPAVQAISTVTASATADRVRFSSPNTVVQLRLEVYDEAGQKLLDTEQRGGNVLDWHLQGGAGERVADGAYVFVLTSKNLSGRLIQRLGLVTVNGQSTVLHSAAVSELNLRQTQTIGPIESGEAPLTVVSAEDVPPVTVLANNGTDGQLARTRGALTFRVGNFFSGNDKEQMRLTEEGNLGIGTTKPKTRLDVAGAIRAREGFMFSDGSTLNVNEKGVLTRTSADGVSPSLVSSTQNRLAKFTDNAGTVGNSGVTEDAGGNIGIGTTVPAYKLDVEHGGGTGIRVKSTSSFSVVDIDAQSGDAALRFARAGVNQWNIRNNPTTDDLQFFELGGGGERMLIQNTTGNLIVNSNLIVNTNVGIGTAAPTQSLHLFKTGATANVLQAFQNGTRNWSVGINGTSDFFRITDNTLGLSRLTILNDGRIGIGTNAPDQVFSVNGDASKVGGGSWQTFSDERLKNIKGRFNSGLKAVMQLQPIRYEYKPDNTLGLKSEGEHIGFGAQALQKIIPEAVTRNSEGYLMVNNDPIMWTMLNAIKEQQTAFREQENAIKEQRNEIAVLKSQVRRLQAAHRRRK